MQRPDSEERSGSKKRKGSSIDTIEKSQVLKKARSLAFNSSQRKHQLLRP